MKAKRELRIIVKNPVDGRSETDILIDELFPAGNVNAEIPEK